MTNDIQNQMIFGLKSNQSFSLLHFLHNKHFCLLKTLTESDWKEQGMILFFTLVLIQTRYWLSLGSLQCVDEIGEPVDWVIMYKLPIVGNKTKGKKLTGEVR